MEINIPIYIVERKVEKGSSFTVKALFDTHLYEEGPRLDKTLNRFKLAVRKKIKTMSIQENHFEFSRYLYYPTLKEYKFKSTLHLRRRSYPCRLIFALIKTRVAQFAYCPSIPELWFTFARENDFESRATEVLTQHFKSIEKDPFSYEQLEEYSLSSKDNAWLSDVQIHLNIQQKKADPPQSLLAFLGAPPISSGEEELEKVGRCLNWMEPEVLGQVVSRDKEIKELKALIDKKEPLLIIGPSGVGKTALIKDYVRREVVRRKKSHTVKNNVWLISPQRLISGMMYVGQWEERFLSIIKALIKHRHIFYTDDLLGFYRAGVTAQSSLSTAEVLKNELRKRPFPLIAEMTPEAYRLLREKDRSFAELFHIMTLHEPGKKDNLKILFQVLRQEEALHQCQFDFKVLGQIITLQRHFYPDKSFPGKGAFFIKNLAQRYKKDVISDTQVLKAFQEFSGLQLNYLDGSEKLDPRAIQQKLSQSIMGQEHIIETLTKIISIGKARLNESHRPLANLLFLGPTGVGKTHCAKVLSQYLFGNDRTLRFDMNEYGSYDAPARLIGTFHNPQGLLTNALLHQPFCVLLFDEIEKAHSDVFDMLLQVLGEGRLTDARGRTVSFCNAIIIMTSNLGVKEAASQIGFNSQNRENSQVYQRAAEQFFRPEFFNRLDHILPFYPLERETIQEIARALIQELFQREGFIRRRCILTIQPQAMEHVIEKGYHPQLGARALKRSIEKEVIRPTARHLSGFDSKTPMLINIYPALEQSLKVQIESLSIASPQVLPVQDPNLILAQVKNLMSTSAEKVEVLAPDKIKVQPPYPEEQEIYFGMQEKCQFLTEQLEFFKHRKHSRFKPRNPLQWKITEPLEGILTHSDMNNYIKYLQANHSRYGETLEERLDELFLEAHLLKRWLAEPVYEHSLLVFKFFEGTAQPFAQHLLKLEGELFNSHLGLDAEGQLIDDTEFGFILLKGCQAHQLAQIETGTHLFYTKSHRLIPIQTRAFALQTPYHALEYCLKIKGQYEEWLKASTAGYEHPLPVENVLRIYLEEGPVLDIRSSRLFEKLPSGHLMRQSFLYQLYGEEMNQ